jgi:hypothetical protein
LEEWPFRVYGGLFKMAGASRRGIDSHLYDSESVILIALEGNCLFAMGFDGRNLEPMPDVEGFSVPELSSTSVEAQEGDLEYAFN